MRISSLFLLSTILLGSPLSCGGKTKTRDISEIPERSGTPLVSVSKRFVDEDPELSADGTVVAFISGKDSEIGSRPRFRAFVSSWPAGAGPTPPTLLNALGVDLGEETELALAADGTKAVVVSVKDGQTDLFLQAVSGGEPVQVTNDLDKETRPALSPDGQSVAFLRQTVGQVGLTLSIVDLGDGTGGNFVRHDFGLRQVLDFAFSTTNQLVIVDRDPGTADTRINTLNYTSVDSIDETTLTTVVDNARLAKPGIKANGTTVFYAEFPASPTAKSGVSGTYVYADPPYIELQSEPAFLNLNSGAITRFDALPGQEVLAVSLASNFDLVYWASRFVYRCADSPPIYGGSLVKWVVNSGDPSLILLKKEEGSWVLGDAACVPLQEELAEGEEVDAAAIVLPPVNDVRIENVILNGAATVDNHRLAYVTRQSEAKFGDCTRKVADPEIRLMDVSGGAITVYSLLEVENRAEIPDDPPPAGQTCP